MTKSLFVYCNHCGSLVDVIDAKKTQLKDGRIKKYEWGIGAPCTSFTKESK